MGCKKCAEEGIPLSDCVCPKEDHTLLRQKICFPPYEAETQTFEAMRRLAPSSRDVQTARRYLKNSGYGEVIYDRYLVNRAGSSNKYYYTSITEKGGKYYPMGAYGRIGALSALFNIKGKKGSPKASCSSMEEAYRYVKTKERSKVNKKGDKAYTDYTLQMAEQFEANGVVGNPSPTFNENITGQDGPETEPTNATMKAESFGADDRHSRPCGNPNCSKPCYSRATGEVMSDGTPVMRYTSLCEPCLNKFTPYIGAEEVMNAESLAEIEGPTEEATAGGLHSPSSFAMTWEDGTGYSSASIPPNEIAWAEGKDENVVVKAVKTPIGAVFVGTALALLGYSFITGGNLLKDLGKGAKSAVSSAAENRKTGCRNCGKTVRKDSEYSVGQINPVEVEGQTDVHGAEQVSYADPYTGPTAIPEYTNRPSLKMW